MNPFVFFPLQLACVLGWICSLGAQGFVLTHGHGMAMVLQGWYLDPIEIEVC